MDPEMIPSDCEDKPPVAMKRCTRTQCKGKYQCRNMIPITDPRKWCPQHRKWQLDSVRRANAKPENKKKRAEYDQRPERKQSQKESRERPAVKQKRKENSSRWHKSPNGKAIQKVHNDKPINKLRCRLFAMTQGRVSQSLIRLGCFASNEDVRAHFESTWEPWMNWENYGKHRSENGYGVAWQFGHKLPCAIFDAFNLNDMRKCFLPMNLYAQDAKDNNEKLCRLVYSDDELLALRPCWPDAAKNSLVLLKALFSGAAARAVAEGSSSSTHSAAADSEAEAQAEDSEVDLAEDSGEESAEDSEAEATAEED